MFGSILDFFFPSNIYCIACGNLIDNSRPYSLCDKCVRSVNWLTDNTCEICGKALGFSAKDNKICFECMGVQHNFTKGFSCTTYEGPVKEILSGLKYKGHSYYAKKMAEIMNDRSQGFLNDLKIDIIIPVPMSKKKERERGYNQAALLASSFAKKTDIRISTEILIKKRDTESMSSLNAEERRINLHNAFDIGYNGVRDIDDKNILLIDDVYTTGSTLDACAEVLNNNGASNVYIFTFASGVNMKKKMN